MRPTNTDCYSLLCQWQVHRDLKPENFLFSTKSEDAVIKIIDFGLSRHDDTATKIMNTKVGTPYYVAPEVLNREYTKSCDIWSIGVITYILLCGYPPFYGDTDNQIFDCVRAARFDFPSPDWDGISQAAKDFICALLRKDPSKRLTASEALQHPWVQEMSKANSQRGRQNLRASIVFSPQSITFLKYRGMQKLKKAALTYIATNVTNDEISALKDVFLKIDVNNDGTLTLQELDECLENGKRSFLGYAINDSFLVTTVVLSFAFPPMSIAFAIHYCSPFSPQYYCRPEKAKGGAFSFR